MGTWHIWKRPLRIFVTAALVLAVCAVLAVKAHTLVGIYRQYKAVEQSLPELPVVRWRTLQRPTDFPAIWLQRVDGVERAVLMAHHYKGMEIDVVYDAAADFFDVGHPPVPSQGISLDQVFASIPQVQNYYFWIDLKNLTADNERAACRRLLATAQKYGIVQHMIVESPAAKALSCFSENGFYTSYYLFSELKLSSMGRKRVTEYYEEIKTNLMASKVNALSSTYHAVPFIEKYFPDADILTWYSEPRTRRLRYYAALAYLRLKPNIKVILVHRWSPGYR